MVNGRLLDMHGNAHEITEDYYGAMFSLTAAATREDPLNRTPPDGRPLRVIRGGCYFSSAPEARSAKRETVHEATRLPEIGLRLVLAEAAVALAAR